MTAMKSEDNATICIIVLGMAGSGKTSFTRCLSKYLKSIDNAAPWIINLDPAALELPYKPNVDIRKTVEYEKIMNQYSLGPNGAILTALNLYASKFDQVVNLIKKRNTPSKYVIIDTPGQIEVFNWSASGSIITECLMSSFPTMIFYLSDSVTCQNPTTFMANMIHACSILYKYQLPCLTVFNKIDKKDCEYAIEWMKDLDKFGDAAEKQEGYVSNLNRSLSIVLDAYYENLDWIKVSSTTGSGFEVLKEKITKFVEEFDSCIKPAIQNQIKNPMKQQNKVPNDKNGTEMISSLSYTCIEEMEFDNESDGSEDLDLPQSRKKLNENEVKESFKKMNV